MADHGGLYSTTRLEQIGAIIKVALARCARVAFPVVKGEREGGCGRMACSLVALDSLVRGSRGHPGALRCSFFLGEEVR
jgi:hypothetical protein